MGDLLDEYFSLRVTVLKTVYENFNASGATELETKYTEVKDAVEKSMEAYQATVINQEDQDNLNSLKIDMEDYFNEVQQVINLAKTGDKTTIDTEMEHVGEVATKVADELYKMQKYNVVQGDLKMDSNTSLGRTSMMVMIGLAAVLTGIAAFLAIVVTKGITKPVYKMVEAAEKLAAGDTNIALKIQTKDEIGVLALSFGKCVEAIKKLIADAKMLTEASMEGKLATRADVSAHQGDYRKIVEGVNMTLDAVLEPINEAVNVLKEMQQGNLSQLVTGEYKGEHAIIKDGLNDTLMTIKGYIGEISAVLRELADGNLNIEITSEYRGEFVELKESINAIISSLNSVMGDINTAAEQVAAGTRQVSDGSQEISQGATEQSSSIEELTASITQIAAQTKQNAMGANNANELTLNARNSAVEGNEQMKAMQVAMTEINEASMSISRIIKVIDDIAFQTNILALNAAVEAARAGVHGKGFAVVAEEVRNLAARSANAAKETTELIEGSIIKTAAGTKIADETAAALAAIVSGVEKSGELVGQIATASNEQATAIAQVNRGIEQMSGVVQGNSATAEEAAAAAEQLSSQAEMLKNLVNQFRLKDADVKAVILPAKDAGNKIAEVKNTIRPTIKLSDSDFGKY